MTERKNRKNPYDAVSEKAKDIIPNWTKTELYDILTEYFCNSERFNSRGEGYSLKKGIHCIGSIGTGKTKAFEVIQEMLRGVEGKYFQIIECRHIVRDYKTSNDSVIDIYGRDSRKAVCFDELGLEEQGVRVFGNTTNVMAEILTDRYKLFTDKGIKTFTISNLSMSNFEKMYGERLRDRIREMSNVIVVEGDSFRK